MAVVIIEDVITAGQLVIVQEEYGEFVKVVVDIERDVLAAGGEWHADAEKVLLAYGSRQENLWGGSINVLKKKVEFNSLINMRPKLSTSQEVLDQTIRDKMEVIIRKVFEV